MKNVVLILNGMVLLLLSLLILMAIYGRMNHSMELQSNLSSVMEEQINEMMLNEEYSITNTQEFLTDFIGNLVVALDGKYDLTIDVLQVDMEKGILSVRVTADFLYLNGNRGTTVCERTVIFDRLQ